jgi:hypothetical protein
MSTSTITAEAKKAGEKLAGKVMPLTPTFGVKDCESLASLLSTIIQRCMRLMVWSFARMGWSVDSTFFLAGQSL